jgi:hypothetical protein
MKEESTGEQEREDDESNTDTLQEKPRQPQGQPEASLWAKIKALGGRHTENPRKSFQAIVGHAEQQNTTISTPEQGATPSQSQEVTQENREQNVDDRLASEGKEFDKNVGQLTQNLAALGNSSGEPGKGSQVTQEKWKKLKGGLKTAGRLAVEAFIIDPLISGMDFSKGVPVTGIGFVDSQVARYARERMAMKQSLKKGWEKIKGGSKAENQGVKPK